MRDETKLKQCRYVLLKIQQSIQSRFKRNTNKSRSFNPILQALQGRVTLEGDVITSNDSILSGHIGHETVSFTGDNTSICSCHCACFRASKHKRYADFLFNLFDEFEKNKDQRIGFNGDFSICPQ